MDDLKVTPSSTDTYLSVILSRPLNEVWNIFLLGLARIVPTIAIAPFFGGKMIGDVVKLGLGVCVTLVFLPFLILTNPDSFSMDVTFILTMAKEAVIGAMLGFFIAIPFYYAQGAGALIDHQRGSQSLQVMDPTTQMQTSPTGTLYNDILLVLFFAIGGPILFFDGLFTSFALIPLDAFFPPQFFDLKHPFWITIVGMLTTVVKIALQLSAPSIIGMLLSDLFLGIANRMAPQVQISFLLWSFKAFIGIAMLFLAWWLVIKQLDVQATAWLKTYSGLVKSF
ncbi:MAG: EscT/YscT/HrcT family type III secretion system export apparatus protein [Chlamydiales bacterium]|nr:EscT/YscT/HrcT family type III secretion system export apparatus protein [Chlamydiales bacterium]